MPSLKTGINLRHPGPPQSLNDSVGESALATPLWGMLYADDVGVVLQSPEQLSKMMGVIVVVCAAFGLTVSEAQD